MGVLDDLKTFEKIYPIFIQKYETYIPSEENSGVTEKINSMIQYLSQIGRLNNDVVNNWNKVMKWLLEEGLGEVANVEIVKVLESGIFDDMMRALVTEQTQELDILVEGKVEELETILVDLRENGTGIDAQARFDLTKTATKIELNNVLNGSPKGTYATLSALQTAFPTGTTGIYVVTADGNIYSWSGSAWVSRGLYQAIGIANDSVGKNQLKSMRWAEIINDVNAGELSFNTVDKTVTLTKNAFVSNSDGYVQAKLATIPYGDDATATFICVHKTTGDLFVQNISTATTAYAFILCRIFLGRIYSPFGFRKMKVNGLHPNASTTDFELAHGTVKQEHLNFKVSRVRLYTLADAWSKWKLGIKFPVAIIGDSTTESTTDPVSYNTLGTNHIPVGAYPTVLENMIKAETGNNLLRIYNAGFSSKNAVWSLANINALIKNNVTYADTKMLGIRHGINDPLENATTTDYIDTFRNAMRGLIDWCIANAIQPFLITPQPTFISFPLYAKPAYTSAEMVNISLSVLRELAVEYNLELVDNHTFTKKLQLKIENIASLTSDGLHYKTEGHLYQAGFLFSEFNKETIKLSEPVKIGYNHPEVRSGISGCEKLTSQINGFNTRLTTTATGDVFKVNLFNHFKYGAVLDFIFTSTGSVTVTVNGVDYVLTSSAHTVSVAGMGLITVKVKNTNPNSITFYGVDVS